MVGQTVRGVEAQSFGRSVEIQGIGRTVMAGTRNRGSVRPSVGVRRRAARIVARRCVPVRSFARIRRRGGGIVAGEGRRKLSEIDVCRRCPQVCQGRCRHVRIHAGAWRPVFHVRLLRRGVLDGIVKEIVQRVPGYGRRLALGALAGIRCGVLLRSAGRKVRTPASISVFIARFPTEPTRFVRRFPPRVTRGNTKIIDIRCIRPMGCPRSG